MDYAVDLLSSLTLNDIDVLSLRQGKIVKGSASSLETKELRLYNQEAQFIGIGEQNVNGEIKSKRLIAFSHDASM